MAKVGTKHKAYQQAHTNFELALSDFKFCLNKALENVVQKDDDEDTQRSNSPAKLSDSELKQ